MFAAKLLYVWILKCNHHYVLVTKCSSIPYLGGNKKVVECWVGTMF